MIEEAFVFPFAMHPIQLVGYIGGAEHSISK